MFKHTITELREKKKISQREMAEIVGVSGPYMSMVEAYKRRPNPMLMKKIADVLEKPVHEVFLFDKVIKEKEKTKAPEGITLIPNNLVDRLDLSFDEKAVCLALLRYRSTETPFPGYKAIADLVGMEEEAVKKSIKPLEEKGILKKTLKKDMYEFIVEAI